MATFNISEIKGKNVIVGNNNVVNVNSSKTTNTIDNEILNLISSYSSFQQEQIVELLEMFNNASNQNEKKTIGKRILDFIETISTGTVSETIVKYLTQTT